MTEITYYHCHTGAPFTSSSAASVARVAHRAGCTLSVILATNHGKPMIRTADVAWVPTIQGRRQALVEAARSLVASDHAA